MGSFGVMVWILHYTGLYIQSCASSRQGGHAEVTNHVSGNALFTEVPHDITTHSGRDVEMACSFRGAGAPSYSLEIQWWYTSHRRDRLGQQIWATNQVESQDEMSKDATKISVVKVAGSNISHKLRLSSVKPSDEGTYECRVIDFSDSKPQHHKVHAYLQVEPEQKDGSISQTRLIQSDSPRSEPGEHPLAQDLRNGDRALRRRSVDSTHDCTDSCTL